MSDGRFLSGGVRHEAPIGVGEIRGLYGAATRAGERYHAAMVRYIRAQAAPDGTEEIREYLEEYIALGQQYSTTLELLLAALALSPLKCAQDEAGRIEGLLWRHDQQLSRLYPRLRAGRPDGSHRFQL